MPGKSSTAATAPVDWVLAVNTAADQEAGMAGKLANATVELCCSIGVKLPPFLIAGLCKFSKI